MGLVSLASVMTGPMPGLSAAVSGELRASYPPPPVSLLAGLFASRAQTGNTLLARLFRRVDGTWCGTLIERGFGHGHGHGHVYGSLVYCVWRLTVDTLGFVARMAPPCAGGSPPGLL